ncbi:O-antigen ligase family protein [Rossellomorea vietnamensis]|uniref:O-antigen ligase family protein n=1 Tax=Rossellomorea vietnamensis TaxID=218284 RepID=A0ACD4C3U8_9BACI|nr:O-antigen ligase family protein [Rossellomorea vietnamensis]UXH43178.1 O-antigen ligase family protein [Rossellomorea vietnamensis]
MSIKFSFHKNITFLISLLILVSLITYLPQTLALMKGSNIHTSEEAGLRFLREAILCIIVFYMIFWIKKYPSPSKSFLAVTIFFFCYTLLEIANMISKEYPLLVPISGLRIFQYTPIAYAGFILASNNYTVSLEKIANSLKFFLLIQLVAGIYQILNAPPFFGSTILGSRPFGTFSSPNIFGLTFASCGLLFYFTNNKKNNKWILLSLIGASISGSRSAFLGAVIILGFIFLFKLTKKSRLLFIPSIPLILTSIYFISRSPLISGRDIQGEPRFAVWDTILQNLNSSFDFLFGWGLGLGSNTVTNIFGYDFFDGQFFSDSVYIFVFSSYGIIGFLFYLAVLIFTLLYCKNMKSTLLIFFIAFYSNIFVIWEIFPANVILMLLWGWVLGDVKYSNKQTENNTLSLKLIPNAKSS